MFKLNTVKIQPSVVLDFDIEKAEDMTYGEIQILMDWCHVQNENLFIDLSLQEILNVYRISGDYPDFEAWMNIAPMLAIFSYNSVVSRENEIHDMIN